MDMEREEGHFEDVFRAFDRQQMLFFFNRWRPLIWTWKERRGILTTFQGIMLKAFFFLAFFLAFFGIFASRAEGDPSQKHSRVIFFNLVNALGH
jgi:hypothetical protein